VFVFTLHDKNFLVFRAVHGIIAGMCLISSVFVSAHVHAISFVLIYDDTDGHLEYYLAMHLLAQTQVAVQKVSSILLCTRLRSYDSLCSTSGRKMPCIRSCYGRSVCDA
jgi:hypothetical protein